MLSFALPWVAGAGLLLGLVPLVLHFLVRRPPARAELPTARFLTPDPRTRVALDRRPRDLLLLLLRVAFLLLLGLGLAGPRLVGERDGTATWVLLDGDPGMVPMWEEALSATREVLSGLEGKILLLAMGEVVREIPVAGFVEGEAVSPPVRGEGAGYLGTFRALRRRLEAEPVLDSVEVVLVTRPRREAWTPGFGGVRAMLYPGSVRVVEVGVPGEGEGERAPGEDAAPEAGTGGALVVRPAGEGRYVKAALEALGRTVEVALSTEGRVPAGGGQLVVAPGAGSVAGLLEAAARGDTVVVEAGSPGVGGDPLVWDPRSGTPPGPASSTLLAGDVRVPGALLHEGGPVAGARIPLTGEDGRPAAAAMVLGEGCLVVAGFRLEGGGLPLQPAYPRLLEELARGCRPSAGGSGALDRGALEILRGAGLPRRVGVDGLATETGIDLSHWFLLTALALAILETFLGYRKP